MSKTCGLFALVGKNGGKVFSYRLSVTSCGLLVMLEVGGANVVISCKRTDPGKALFVPSMDTNEKASRRGGCTNQIPLTIKPYPMPPSYGIIEYTSTFCLIKLKTKSISIFR